MKIIFVILLFPLSVWNISVINGRVTLRFKKTTRKVEILPVLSTKYTLTTRECNQESIKWRPVGSSITGKWSICMLQLKNAVNRWNDYNSQTIVYIVFVSHYASKHHSRWIQYPVVVRRKKMGSKCLKHDRVFMWRWVQNINYVTEYVRIH